MSVYAIDPTALDGGFHLRYEGAVGVALSDDPQLLAVDLVQSHGSRALTKPHLVDMMPEFDLPSVEEKLVAYGRQDRPLVGVTDLEACDFLGVAHAPLTRIPLDALQHIHRAPNPSSGSSEVSTVSAATATPLAAPFGYPAWAFKTRSARFVPARLSTSIVTSVSSGV